MKQRFGAEERLRLLRLARESIACHLGGGGLPSTPPGEELCAVFVTLRTRRDGELRGCVGHVEALFPLSEAVARSAVSAACRDQRFEPVRLDELPGLRVEISLLSPLARVSAVEVRAGVHGVMIAWRGRRGLLLPQVAVEQGWDDRELLDHVCAKAGVPERAWRDPEAELSVFTAEVFGENGDS